MIQYILFRVVMLAWRCLLQKAEKFFAKMTKYHENLFYSCSDISLALAFRVAVVSACSAAFRVVISLGLLLERLFYIRLPRPRTERLFCGYGSDKIFAKMTKYHELLFYRTFVLAEVPVTTTRKKCFRVVIAQQHLQDRFV